MSSREVCEYWGGSCPRGVKGVLRSLGCRSRSLGGTLAGSLTRQSGAAVIQGAQSGVNTQETDLTPAMEAKHDGGDKS
jgi:hypothetical protein